MRIRIRLALYAAILISLTIILSTMMASTALAKTITIDENGVIDTVLTHKATVGEVLEEANTIITKKAVVSEQLDAPIEDNSFVKVRYSKQLTLIEDRVTTKWNTTAVTFAEALEAKDIQVNVNAELSTSLDSEIPLEGAKLEITTPKKVNVVTAKKTKKYRTYAVTVKQFLEEENLTLDRDDKMNVKNKDFIKPNMNIKLYSVHSRLVRHRDEITLPLQRKQADWLAVGERRVRAEGSPKIIEKTFWIEFTDGKTSKLKLKKTQVIKEGEARTILIGSKMPAVDPTSVKAIAQQMLINYGWAADQFVCLDNLWMRESGWNYLAKNPSSGAYGIPQSLPASKMATAGADYLTNPETQIKWGLGYLKDRYGSPCGGWAHSESHGWY